MEAGVLQEIRMALMGHSSGGSKVHATYTHIELPTKRKAITRLEDWAASQRKEPTDTNSTTTGCRDTNYPTQSETVTSNSEESGTPA
jgi:hypothetical protein